MPDLRNRMNRTERRRMIEAIRCVPWPDQLLRLRLQVAARHVETERIAVHVIERLGSRDVLTLLADRGHELHREVDVLRLRRIREFAGRTGRDVQHGVGRLAEEKRRLAIRIVPHLARVRLVVPADAVNAANGKLVAGTDNGHRNRGCRSKYMTHSSFSCVMEASTETSSLTCTVVR